MVKDAKILKLELTCKEKWPDRRNTKVIDIYTTHSSYTTNIVIYDPWLDKEKVKKELNLNIENENIDTLKGVFDTVVLCVAHREFKEMNIREFLRDDTGIVYDVKGYLDKKIINGRL